MYQEKIDAKNCEIFKQQAMLEVLFIHYACINN